MHLIKCDIFVGSESAQRTRLWEGSHFTVLEQQYQDGLLLKLLPCVKQQTLAGVSGFMPSPISAMR